MFSGDGEHLNILDPALRALSAAGETRVRPMGLLTGFSQQ